MSNPNIRSQIVTLKVFYDSSYDHERGAWSLEPPERWDWDSLVEQPVSPSVEVLAAGPIVDYPVPETS